MAKDVMVSVGKVRFAYSLSMEDALSMLEKIGGTFNSCKYPYVNNEPYSSEAINSISSTYIATHKANG